MTACAQADDAERLGAKLQRLPVVGEVQPIEPAVDAPAPGSSACIATDGTRHLAVWLGERDTASVAIVHAAFLGDDGVPIDGGEIEVAAEQTSELAVTWTGSSFLVVWSVYGPPGAGLSGRRISSDGSLLDAAPLVLLAGAGTVSTFDLASRDAESLLVWSQNSSELRYSRIAENGSVLDPEGLALGIGGLPTVVWDGTNYVVAWLKDHDAYSFSDVLAARIDASGALLDPGGIETGVRSFTTPILGAGAGGTLLTWTKNLMGNFECPDCNSDAYATRLGPALEVVDPDGIPIAVTSDGDYSHAVIAQGDDFLVATTIDTRIHLIPVSAEGEVGSSLGAVTGALGAQIIPVGTGALGVFYGYGPVLAVPVDPAGLQDLDAAAVPVSRKANSQEFPALVTDGAGDALLAWRDDRGKTPSVYGRHITASGSTSGSQALLLGSGTGSGPAAARAGADYLVTWTSDETDQGLGHIRGRFMGLAAALDVSGSEGIGVQPSVSCIGSTCCVAWRDEASEIRVSIVTPSGVRFPPAVDVSHFPRPLESPTWFPASLAMGDHFLVAWYRGSATVQLDGTVSAPSAVGEGVPYHSFAAASNGKVALAAWTEIRDTNPLHPGPTLAVVLGPDGGQLEHRKIVLEAATEGLPWDPPPAVGWDGANFLVVVQGRAYRVTSEGRLLDTAGGFAVEPADTGAIVAMSPTSTLYVGSRVDSSLGVARLFSQTIERGTESFPQGAGCGINEECESGACEDGVCCQGPCGPNEACNIESHVGECTDDGTETPTTTAAVADSDSDGCSVPSHPARGSGTGGAIAALIALALVQRRR